ncbi:hypothetical protein ACWGBX_38915, partial [Streptomyces sp. NPDC055037]
PGPFARAGRRAYGQRAYGRARGDRDLYGAGHVRSGTRTERHTYGAGGASGVGAFVRTVSR